MIDAQAGASFKFDPGYSRVFLGLGIVVLAGSSWLLVQSLEANRQLVFASVALAIIDLILFAVGIYFWRYCITIDRGEIEIKAFLSRRYGLRDIRGVRQFQSRTGKAYTLVLKNWKVIYLEDQVHNFSELWELLRTAAPEI